MTHQLPQLPFAMDALAPTMSKETLEYHYGKHHKAYVDKLNTLIPGTEFENMKLEEIIVKAPAGGIFNNAAQVWNHTFFWNCLTPSKKTPGGDLEKAISQKFGSFDKFKTEFADKAVTLFGSGWAWLVRNKDGSLSIEQTSNAGNPMKDGKVPLFTCDVWEHAYYIDYRNARPKFVENIWNIVNWDFVAKNFANGKAVAA